MMQDSRPTPRGRNAATFVALMALIIMAIGLLLLTGMVWPQVLGIVIVGGGFLGILGVHYFLWGWWLPMVMPAEEPDE